MHKNSHLDFLYKNHSCEEVKTEVELRSGVCSLEVEDLGSVDNADSTGKVGNIGPSCTFTIC